MRTRVDVVALGRDGGCGGHRPGSESIYRANDDDFLRGGGDVGDGEGDGGREDLVGGTGSANGERDRSSTP